MRASDPLQPVLLGEEGQLRGGVRRELVEPTDEVGLLPEAGPAHVLLDEAHIFAQDQGHNELVDAKVRVQVVVGGQDAGFGVIVLGHEGLHLPYFS